MNASKYLLLFACLLSGGQAAAQDRTNTDGNTDTLNPRNPSPQGPGTPGFGSGQPAGSRFEQKKDEVDAQTGARPTDRRGVRPESLEVETNENRQAAPKRKKKAKKSREQLRKARQQGAQKAPASPVDKELPAVSDPTKDGTLIEDGPPPVEVPHD